MDIKINSMNMYMNSMDMFINNVPYVPPTSDVLFKLDPEYLLANENEWTMNGINANSTVGKIGFNSAIGSFSENGNYILSPYNNAGKTEYDAINGEQIEAPITLEDMQFNFSPNTTVNMFMNIRAPLKRMIFEKGKSTRRTKSGNVAFFYNTTENSGTWKKKIITVGYKCPYYLMKGMPDFKYEFTTFQFVLGMPNTTLRKGYRYIMTDFAYNFDSWYLISLVSGKDTVKLFINGIATKIMETKINVIQHMRGQQINYNEHTEIITAPYYKNTYNEILEDNFSYEINYEQNVSEINGYSTGVLMVTSPYENIKSLRMKSCGSQAKNYNGNTDTGKIEVFSKAMTDEEITTYYNDNVGTYQ